MKLNRRCFMGGILAGTALAGWSSRITASTPIIPRVIRPRDFGAMGDGLANDTAALHRFQDFLFHPMNAGNLIGDFSGSFHVSFHAPGGFVLGSPDRVGAFTETP